MLSSVPECDSINIVRGEIDFIMRNGKLYIIYRYPEVKTGEFAWSNEEELNSLTYSTDTDLQNIKNFILSMAKDGVFVCDLFLEPAHESAGNVYHLIPLIFYQANGMLNCVVSEPNAYAVDNNVTFLAVDDYKIWYNVRRGDIVSELQNIFQNINVIEYPIIGVNIGNLGRRLDGICSSESDIIVSLLHAIACGKLKYRFNGKLYLFTIPETNAELMDDVFRFANDIKPRSDSIDSVRKYLHNIDATIKALINSTDIVNLDILTQKRRRRRSRRSRRSRRR